MEEQIYAFLAGGILGAVVLFVILALMGASDANPDNW